MAPVTSTSDDFRIEKSKSLKLTGDVIKIRVGTEPNQETFVVHEALICPRSAFFRRAMNGNWKESEERLVKMPEDDPEIFSLYIHLIYTGLLPCKLDLHPTVGSENVICAQLYVLGEKIQDLDLKNKSTQAILRWARETKLDGKTYSPGPTSIAIIYEGTPGPCPIRRMLVDLYAFAAQPSWSTSVFPDCPDEFMRDLADKLLETRCLPKGAVCSAITCDFTAYNENPKSTEKEKPKVETQDKKSDPSDNGN